MTRWLILSLALSLALAAGPGPAAADNGHAGSCGTDMSRDAHAGMDHDAADSEACDCGCDCPPTHACHSSQVSALTSAAISAHAPALPRPDAGAHGLRPRSGTAPPLRPPAASSAA